FAAESLGCLQVVLAVRAALAVNRLGGLVERPAQRGRSPAGEVAGSAAQIGLMDRDVKARVADRLARGGEPACVAELGEDRDRGQMTDPVETHQRLAAWLAPGVGTQLLVHRRELSIRRAYHLERDRYLLARGGRQLEA